MSGLSEECDLLEVVVLTKYVEDSFTPIGTSELEIVKGSYRIIPFPHFPYCWFPRHETGKRAVDEYRPAGAQFGKRDEPRRRAFRSPCAYSDARRLRDASWCWYSGAGVCTKASGLMCSMLTVLQGLH